MPQPAWDLVRALNTLVDGDRRILIDGWYEGIWQLGEDERSSSTRPAAGPQQAEARVGDRAVCARPRRRRGDRARAYEPTGNIPGLISGYTGPGIKTIVPNEARVKLDFRLPRRSTRPRRSRSSRAISSSTASAISRSSSAGHAEPPYKISVKEDISQAIIAAATTVYGELPVVNGVSAEGTILRHVWIPRC